MAGLQRENGAYRRDIDGLRAVAILSVVGYHAFPARVPGGFVGVDVFFVISGFLITGIILRGLARGRYDLLEFYARRIRRIFPALLAMLLAVWVLGWLKFLPREYDALAKHIAAGSAYVSNFLLYKESGYFDVTAALKPLLHLWSLGVEEQFYIVWPLLLIVTWKWRAQLPLLVAVTCASFALNVLAIGQHPVATFYLPVTRLWELSLGGVLACVQLADAPRRAALAAVLHSLRALPRARELAAGAGLALLAASIAVLDPQRLFPGWWALAPTVGTLLLIAAGERTWINRRLLGNRAMVYVGLVSYPLYLWHWPVLSVMRIVEGASVTVTATLCALALAAALSVLTYHFIERPIRALQPARRIAAPLLVAVSAVGVAGYATYARGLEPLSARYGVQRILSAASERFFPGPDLAPLATRDGTLLAQGDRTGNLVLFIGDSNVEQYYPRVDALLTHDPERTRGVVYATYGGCPPLPGVREAHHPRCAAVLARAIAFAADPRVTTIVIGASWEGYLYDPDPQYAYYFESGDFRGRITAPSEGARRAMRAFADMVAGFVRLGKKVYIILQIPDERAFDPHAMVRRGFGTLRFAIDAHPRPREAVAEKIAAADSWVRRIAQRAGAAAIDPLPALCGATVCPALDDGGRPIYRDSGHLRPSWVRMHIHFLDAILRMPGAPPLAAAAPGADAAQ